MATTRISQFIQASPEIIEAYDTSTPGFVQFSMEVAHWFNDEQKSFAELDDEAKRYSGNVAFRTALKIVESKRIISGIDQKVTVTLLNPVYKETGRMQSRGMHPHGENSIRFKIQTLQELEALNPLFTARFVVIDDECPDNSGLMARTIIKNECPKAYKTGKYKVLFLGTAIDEKDPGLPPGITHKSGSNRSVKGGALLYGIRSTVNDISDGLHILIDNDADLSIHPAQTGLLIKEILSGKTKVVAGSRRESDSVSLIGCARNSRGQFFIKIWRYLLPQLAKTITDTNRAFKAFESEALKKILHGIKIYTFPYQIELLQACISHGIPLQKRGISYIDSEAASTQSGSDITESYLNQIRQIIDIALRYHTINPNDKLLQYFLSISEEEWMTIENNPPDNMMDLIN